MALRPLSVRFSQQVEMLHRRRAGEKRSDNRPPIGKSWRLAEINGVVFQRGIAEVISKAKGFEGYKVNKGIESPERYLLQCHAGWLRQTTLVDRDECECLQVRES